MSGERYGRLWYWWDRQRPVVQAVVIFLVLVVPGYLAQQRWA